MKNFGGIKIIMIAELAFIIFAGTCAAASLSNSGGGTWKYQPKISIKENSGTTLTDYQVLIELKGADFPVEARSDGADVRFTDSDGNELNYWIESWDYAGKSARIWVKMPSLKASTTVIIRMYYGNPSATSSSNGHTTFEFFDNFDGDLSKWTILEGATAVIENGEVSITDTPDTEAFIHSTTFQTKNGIIEAKIKVISTTFVAHWIIDGRWMSPDSFVSVTARQGSGYNDFYIYDSPSNKGDVSWTDNALNTWFLFQLKMNDNNLEGNVYNMGGTLLKSTQGTSSKGTGFVGIRSWGSSHTHYDDVRVRKYASSEPTIILSPPTSPLSITKSASPYSLRQFQESTIKVLIENSGTSEIKAIEIMDSIHPSFDFTGGDFPNPKKFYSIRAGESRELQYTIRSKESGAFILDPATVTYADSEGNIQVVKSEPVSIKVVSSPITTVSVQPSPLEISPTCIDNGLVYLHGEKTDVFIGEDILLKLSAVNLITKPPMSVQVMIYPPSGMSVTGSEFVKSGAGIYTTTYALNPGDGKDIQVHIKSNQVGDFNIKGRIVYYFGEDKNKAEDCTLNLPIKVWKEPIPSASPTNGSGFGLIIGLIGLLLLAAYKKRF